nr:hypothetical protein [Streptococcus ruminantium]
MRYTALGRIICLDYKTKKRRKGKDRKQQVDVYFNFIGNCQVLQRADIEKWYNNNIECNKLDFVGWVVYIDLTKKQHCNCWLTYFQGGLVAMQPIDLI